MKAAASKLAPRKSQHPSEGSDTAKTSLDSGSPAHSSDQPSAANVMPAASPQQPDAEPLNPSSASSQEESESSVVSVSAQQAGSTAQLVDIHRSAPDDSHRTTASPATSTQVEETCPSDVPGNHQCSFAYTAMHAVSLFYK